jgi:cystathionine beta-lyase
MTYNFDNIVDRKNTNCIKYDFATEFGKSSDAIPMWIADMDFAVPVEIIEALQECLDHGIFGYTDSGPSYFRVIYNWMLEKHDWRVTEDWLVKCPGVVFALCIAVQAFSEPGESVMIQQPVYHPFRQLIRDNRRKVVDNPLILDDKGRYHMDLEDFEKKAVENQVKILILCNPHNPVGRVWTREELQALGEVCIRHDIIVLSDEIHQDFVFKGKHQVFANINDAISERTITFTAPSKTFNLAGLQASNIFISNPKLKKIFCDKLDATGYGPLNTMGMIACEAAYAKGEAWLEQLVDYLQGNVAFINEFLTAKIPEVKLIESEGTFVAWLDLRELNLTEEEQYDLINNKAKLWLDPGTKFGPQGAGFERMNIGCPRPILKRAMEQLEKAVQTLKSSRSN